MNNDTGTHKSPTPIILRTTFSCHCSLSAVLVLLVSPDEATDIARQAHPPGDDLVDLVHASEVPRYADTALATHCERGQRARISSARPFRTGVRMPSRRDAD